MWKQNSLYLGQIGAYPADDIAGPGTIARTEAPLT